MSPVPFYGVAEGFPGTLQVAASQTVVKAGYPHIPGGLNVGVLLEDADQVTVSRRRDRRRALRPHVQMLFRRLMSTMGFIHLLRIEAPTGPCDGLEGGRTLTAVCQRTGARRQAGSGRTRRMLKLAKSAHSAKTIYLPATITLGLRRPKRRAKDLSHCDA